MRVEVCCSCRAVEIALREFPNLSSRQIAEMCGVSHHTVEAARPDEALGTLPNATRTTSDGRQYPARREQPKEPPQPKEPEVMS